MDSVEEDEEGNKSSPPETVTEPGSTLACSAATGPGGKTSGSKRKTEVGPTSPKPKKKKTKRCPSLGTTFKQAEDDVLLVQEQPYMYKNNRIKFFRAFRSAKCNNNSS